MLLISIMTKDIGSKGDYQKATGHKATGQKATGHKATAQKAKLYFADAGKVYKCDISVNSECLLLPWPINGNSSVKKVVITTEHIII